MFLRRIVASSALLVSCLCVHRVCAVESSPTAGVRVLPEITGKSVAIWSKFNGRFVRSPGVANGTLMADRDAYDANGGEGRFLCAAEAGGTICLMDLLLQKYVTVINGALVSATVGTPKNRRFTLENQGNNYYAIRADNGLYVRADQSGDLAADARILTDESLFSIVPIRSGPNVVMRAYNGDIPQNQKSNMIPNEVALFSDNPADFPVNKVNIGTLQMTAGLSTDQQLIKMRKVWNTKRYEDEAIIPYNTTTPLAAQMDSIVSGIKRIESLGYTYDYIVLYHEILANLPGGPWSDPRISSPEEITLLRERIKLGHNRGDLKHPTYKIFTMPYQFQTGTTMGIAPVENTPVGCDPATLAFIKENFDGMFLEVNGHDYLSRNEHIDAAKAAVWCRANGLEFGITSGQAAIKDTVYKSMYQNIFAQMDAVGFDKSWSGAHYILHHMFQPYADRLPEWMTDTNTENSRWLIEQVKPHETWALSEIDTDGDGTGDEAEIRAGTYPLDPSTTMRPPGARKQ
jgi:hypothetical protein